MALVPAPLLNQKYPIRSDGSEITLKAYIGNGQLTEGRYYVRPNMKSPDTLNGNIESGQLISLGKDTDLHGQRLSILITVAAITGKNTQVQFIVSGGQKDFNFTLKVDVDNLGDTVAYEAYFRFTLS